MCVWWGEGVAGFLLCYVVLSVLSVFAIILLRKRELECFTLLLSGCRLGSMSLPCSAVGWSVVVVGLRYFLIIPIFVFGKEHSLRFEFFQHYQSHISIITPTLNLFTTLLLTHFSQMEFPILINLTCTFPF